MANKRVTIGAGDLTLQLLRATEVKESEEIDSDITKTFDEAVTTPSSDGGFNIDISVLETRSVTDFITLKRIIKLMKNEVEGNISVFEDHKHKEGNFTAERHYTGVRLSSNDATTSAEDLTARDLSFIAQAQTEKVNGEEI